MSETAISAELREFMLAHVRTYEQLEALVLLATHADQAWTAQSLGEALKIPLDRAEEALQALASGRVLRAAEASPLAYHLSDPEVQRLVRALGQTYERNRLLVMQVMNENALERMRTDALRAFSNAFVIRGRNKDG